MTCNDWAHRRSLFFSIVAMLALMVAGCGDDNGNGNGEATTEVDTPEFFETTEVATYAEFQSALDDAAEFSVVEDEEHLELDPIPEHLVAPDSAYLIEITDDIDDGFEEEGQLEYNGEANIYIRAASGMQTIDAGGHSRILDVGLVETMWVEELRFVGGYAEGDRENGGAISSNVRELYIINCEFENNHAGFRGGAIRDRVDLEIIDSTFRDNTSVDRGGAVIGGSVNVKNSTFRNNIAIERTGGGAIAAGRVDIEGSEFLNNEVQSGENGGAIRVRGGGTISGSIFDGNESQGRGGAIGRGLADTDESDVDEPLIISNSEFINNHAHRDGGAIYATGIRVEEDAARISIEDSHFESNTISVAEGGAGAVFTDAEDEDIITANSTYIDNDEPVLSATEGELIDDGGNNFEGNEDPLTE